MTDQWVPWFFGDPPENTLAIMSQVLLRQADRYPARCSVAGWLGSVWRLIEDDTLPVIGVDHR